MTWPHPRFPRWFHKGWSKINLKACDVISCLNKNSITHSVWYPVKKIWRWNFLNWQSIKKGAFAWKNYWENVHQKFIPDPFLILLNNTKQPLHIRNSFTNQIFERELSKSFRKHNLIFLSNHMSSACHSNVIRMSWHSYVTLMY